MSLNDRPENRYARFSYSMHTPNTASIRLRGSPPSIVRRKHSARAVSIRARTVPLDALRSAASPRMMDANMVLPTVARTGVRSTPDHSGMRYGSNLRCHDKDCTSASARASAETSSISVNASSAPSAPVSPATARANAGRNETGNAPSTRHSTPATRHRNRSVPSGSPTSPAEPADPAKESPKESPKESATDPAKELPIAFFMRDYLIISLTLTVRAAPLTSVPSSVRHDGVTVMALS